MALRQMGLFIKDDYNNPYRKMFVDFYEDSKKILKDQPIGNPPEWYRKEHLAEMKRIDGLKGELKEGDSLVRYLINFLEEKIN